MAEDLRTPEEWCRLYGVEVLTPSGWDDGIRNWEDPIAKPEFVERVSRSTARFSEASQALFKE